MTFEYADLIGKPFAWGGRGPACFDCYGLVLCLLKRAGMNPPDYPSSEHGMINSVHIIFAMGQWQEVPFPKAGVAVVFKMNSGRPTHVGVMVSKDQFLHITEKTDVVVERISSPLWRNRIVGFYSWPH